MHTLIEMAMANGWILHFMPFIDGDTDTRIPGKYFLKLFHADHDNWQRLVIEDQFITGWHDGDFNEYALHRAVNGARGHIYKYALSGVS